MDGENPTRRYKWFRPRQAARVHYDTHNNQNFNNKATLSLFNTSSVTHVLVLRALEGDSGAGNPFVSAVLEGTFGAEVATPSPFFPGDGIPPGRLYFLDDANTIAADWLWEAQAAASPGRWFLPFPFAIVPPRWSFVVQATQAAADLQISLLYEAITIDELDYLAW